MYYYIVATLPYLSFTDTTETDIEGFLSFTQRMLPEDDFAVLESVHTRGGDVQHPFAREAEAFQAELVSELARNRAVALGQDQNQYSSASSARIAEKARQYAGMDDPFEAEKGLMELTWEFLDSLESGHYFDLERLVVHLLKLILLERKNKLTEERGTARYAETYENITKPLQDAEIGT